MPFLNVVLDHGMLCGHMFTLRYLPVGALVGATASSLQQFRVSPFHPKRSALCFVHLPPNLGMLTASINGAMHVSVLEIHGPQPGPPPCRLQPSSHYLFLANPTPLFSSPHFLLS